MCCLIFALSKVGILRCQLLVWPELVVELQRCVIELDVLVCLRGKEQEVLTVIWNGEVESTSNCGLWLYSFCLVKCGISVGWPWLVHGRCVCISVVVTLMLELIGGEAFWVFIWCHW